MSATDAFLDQYLRTHRFQLGVPSSFTVSPDGERVVFLRTRSGGDPLSCLWTLSAGTGEEQLVVDPDDILPPAEDRGASSADAWLRERTRQRAHGITAYATDAVVDLAVFCLDGRVCTARLGTRQVRTLETARPAFDPRPSPDGTRIAYVHAGSLRTVGVDGRGDSLVVAPEGENVTYGVAEHVAAESMERLRGFWWSPDSRRLMVARVDTTSVERWYLSDPARPATPPRQVAYPAAGTANADVSLWLVSPDEDAVAVEWDRKAFEYVVEVNWSLDEPLVLVQDRTQRRMRVLAVAPATGRTRVVREETDPCWVTVVKGVPAVTASGRLVTVTDQEDSRRLLVDGEAVTPPGLQVREVVGTDGETVFVRASREPTRTGLWSWDPSYGARQETRAAGVWNGRVGGGTVVSYGRAPDRDGWEVTVRDRSRATSRVRSLAERPLLKPNVQLLRVGQRKLRVAVVRPAGSDTDQLLPVLMDPYAGPYLQRVTEEQDGYLLPQWLAEQGFAVVIIDGRGTPGRGPGWERTIRGDIATPVLQDQVDGLQATAAAVGGLDLTRVGIRGWSFGGFLAALAVLRRPDVFHAAVAGAPVTDQTLYDTHWRERHLGHPADEPDNYVRSSLIKDAAHLTRPLMLIHGTADDNVVSAHTFRLSEALLRAGRPHTFLPLPGAAHMVADHEVQRNMLLLQVAFLKDALCGSRPPTPSS
ncbi:S9 family peptidase [Streptomyces tsukubensis]|uniref:S9 family peptidase n=1 Tax=Streptomyces tsukubensis TaxID=83656 RepID=A0A1V4A9X5_9ACTN|nr:prolyl oligopeptidase family serine peptidase [Streptomyces tsukubensis]OON79707.1 S9 family peptidase [Streptomyces tsukubensis]QFR95896.1 prolyl oligopeptidase family serine peptidase [Streptomyces tsukubensis]